MPTDSWTFANPQWLYLLLLAVPLVAVKVIASSASRDGVNMLTSPRLRDHLVTARRPLGDWGRFAVQMVGVILLIIALARPQKGYTEEITRVEGRNIIIAIDTSRSMLAEVSKDSKTDRLTQAKLAAIDLVESLPEDRIGLIAFAGTAFMQAPMTPDHGAVIETINQLNTFVVERGGTKLSSAIDLARERVSELEATRSALIMFTDGEDHEGIALQAAERANQDDITIITIGVGSEIPTIVPDPAVKKGTGFLRDSRGNFVKSAMDPESLEKIAGATNGIFIRLQSGRMNKTLVNNVLSNISYSSSEDKLKRTPRERFALPLALGLICVVAGYLAKLWGSLPISKSPAFVTSLLALGFLSSFVTEAPAGIANDAYKAFEDKDFKAAEEKYKQAAAVTKDDQKRYELKFGQGCAAYSGEDYESAIGAFSEALLADDAALQERSHYNLANSLVRKGEALLKDGNHKIDEAAQEWEDAASHYKSALAINPDNDAAKENLKNVEEVIDKLKEPEKEEQPRQEQQQDEEKEEPKEEEEKPEPEKQEQKEDEQKQKGEESDEGEKGEDQSEEGEESKDEPSEEPDEEQPGAEDGVEGAKSESDNEGEESESPGDSGEGGEETDEKSENPGTNGLENPEGEESGEPTGTPGGSSDSETIEEAGEPIVGGEEQVINPDEIINKKTGYSKEQARKALKEMADEQTDLGLLRRRRMVAPSSRYRDW